MEPHRARSSSTTTALAWAMAGSMWNRAPAPARSRMARLRAMSASRWLEWRGMAMSTRTPRRAASRRASRKASFGTKYGVIARMRFRARKHAATRMACAVSSLWSGPLGKNWVRVPVAGDGPAPGGMWRGRLSCTEAQSCSNWRAAATAVGPSTTNERSNQGGVPMSASPVKYSVARLRPPLHNTWSSAITSLRWLRRLRGPARRRPSSGRNTATSPPAARRSSK